MSREFIVVMMWQDSTKFRQDWGVIFNHNLAHYSCMCKFFVDLGVSRLLILSLETLYSMAD